MSTVAFRDATRDDLPAIVAMLADDDIGETREKSAAALPPEYAAAFEAMQRQTGNRQIVAEQDGRLIGCYQFVLVPGLSRQGATRAIVEAVRVAAAHRGKGIGTLLMRHAIAEAKQAGARVVQLTSDKRRPRAHLFYRRLGFSQSHEGFKLDL